MYDLSRFSEAHRQNYKRALAEILNGKKQSHWMWYIFPQISGLGYSETAKFYAIKDLAEAQEFLENPFLGGNLIKICEALQLHTERTASEIFGHPDNAKLMSSLTLFSLCNGAPRIFLQLLDQFFSGKKCAFTVNKIISK